ncbi:MAG: hypothetical protein NUV46_03265 [Nanoarchaeota archaeon]|nr:hypothetical protein [Nanoarchaeota archaeon]
MKKTIDEKNYFILYEGLVEEMKVHLENLIGLWDKNLKEMIIEDLNCLENISSEENKEVSDMYRRIYYSKEKLMYRVNSSDKFTQKFVFPLIVENSKKADKKFLEKNPDYKIVQHNL